MIKSLFKKVKDCTLPSSKMSEGDLKQVWQNYIDGTVGKGLYYLYQDAIKEHFSDSKTGLRALSLGSGAGNEEVDLIKADWEVTAIDRQQRSYEVISERIKTSQNLFHFQLGDFSEIAMNGTYDLVLALFSLPFGRKEELINMILRLAKHTRYGSLVVANFFGSEHSFVEKSMAYAVNITELTELFSQSGFKISYNLNRKFKQLDFSGNKTNWDLIDIIAVRN